MLVFTPTRNHNPLSSSVIPLSFSVIPLSFSVNRAPITDGLARGHRRSSADELRRFNDRIQISRRRASTTRELHARPSPDPRALRNGGSARAKRADGVGGPRHVHRGGPGKVVSAMTTRLPKGPFWWSRCSSPRGVLVSRFHRLNGAETSGGKRCLGIAPGLWYSFNRRAVLCIAGSAGYPSP